MTDLIYYLNLAHACDEANEFYMDDDAEPVTVEWLVANGWQQFGDWPALPLPNGEPLQWRGHGMWIGQIALCRAPTRGHIRKLLDALGRAEL